MQCEVRNVKIHKKLSEETTCFTATLYIDGQKAADVSNRGNGGCHLYHWFNHELETPFKEYAKSLPPIQCELGPLAMDMDGYVDELVIDWDENKTVKRHCKTSTVFRLKTDPKGSWRTIKVPFNQTIKEQIVTKYPDLDTIANELYLKQ